MAAQEKNTLHLATHSGWYRFDRQSEDWVQTDRDGSLARVKVTDPSFKNWPGLAQAVPGNILPDFPVINKSFNLSYSGNDR